jgi:hypothetical protein
MKNLMEEACNWGHSSYTSITILVVAVVVTIGKDGKVFYVLN